jgi:hypothetical protein
MSAPSERRRSRRRPVLESFSVFVVALERAPHRLAVKDVSDLGIGFQLDPDTGQGEQLLQVEVGDTLEISLYLNQSLKLPLRIQVVRIYQESENGPRVAGASILELHSNGYKAFASFIQLLDALAEVRA